MSFGGGSQQTSSSTESINLSDAFAKSISGSLGTSRGTSSGGTFVDPNQQPFLDTLYNQALKTYQGQRPGELQRTAQGIVDPLMRQGRGFTRNMAQLADPSRQIAAQERGLRSGLGRLFDEGSINLGANAAGQGAFGGSRHGVAEAALGGEIARAYTEGRGDIVAGANQTAVNAANVGQSGLGALANLGMMPTQAAWSGLSNFRDLLGGPTVLSQQQARQEAINRASSRMRSGSRSYGRGSSQSMGEGYDFDLGWF